MMADVLIGVLMVLAFASLFISEGGQFLADRAPRSTEVHAKNPDT